MPSRKGFEQALTWLRSKMAEKDTLDAINAEVCYNVILDLRDRKRAIGALYHLTKIENRKLQNDFLHRTVWEDKTGEWEQRGYTPVRFTEEMLKDIFPPPETGKDGV